jgi:uncharacterized protein (DUF111 family)
MTRVAIPALVLALAACGSSKSEPNTTEIQAFNTAAVAVSAAAVDYGVHAASMTSQATCITARDAYDTTARPLVGELQRMGASMDAMMGSMGHRDSGDMGCSANAMMSELDRHRIAACASTTDLNLDKAEAQVHVATMEIWANHEMGRSHDLGSMAGMAMGGMADGTTTGHCVKNADGSYTFQP